MKHHAATVMGVLLTPANPLKCITLRIVHHASVTRTVKQTVQLFRKRYREDVMTVQQSTRVADSSMCVEHIINVA
jgi:hypothetical protein